MSSEQPSDAGMSTGTGSKNYNAEQGQVETTKDLTASSLANKDIMPTSLERRNWGTWDISSLWISMCITIALYYVISGMVAQGLNIVQVLIAVFLGTFLIFIPLILNGHVGAKYGIPFPVLVRSSFGIHGAHIPAIIRGLVACGWFGVQCWIGGLAIDVAMQKVVALTGLPIWPAAGTASWLMPLSVAFSPGAGAFLGFLIFWAISVWIVWNGIESIRWLEVLGAPFLILCFIGLFIWAWIDGGGFVRVMTTGMKEIGAAEGLAGSDFWFVFIPAVMGIIGYWATLSLNIPDFTRYSKSQSSQITGQFIGLNGTMGPFAFVIAFITAGAFLAFMPQFFQENLHQTVQENPQVQQALEIDSALEGEELRAEITTLVNQNSREEILQMARESNVEEPVRQALEQARSRAGGLWDPMALLGTFNQPLVVIIVMVAFAIATLTTNMAANVVAPANSFSNLLPEVISFRAGGVITGIVGLLTFPWILMSNPAFYIDLWLGGAASLLAPIGGIMIGDYFLYRETKLDLDELYKFDGKYFYKNGFNRAGVATFVISILCLFPGWILLLLTQVSEAEFLAGFAESGMSLAPWLQEQGYTFLSVFSWIYLVNWIFGFTVSLLLYWVLARWLEGEDPEADVPDEVPGFLEA